MKTEIPTLKLTYFDFDGGRTAPLLLEHLERISTQSQVAAYYQR